MIKYKIIDNFFNERDFNELCSLNLKKTSNKEINVYINKISNNGDAEVACINKETIKRKNRFERKRISSAPGPK